MVFKIKEIKEPKLDKFLEESIFDLGKFFRINWKYNSPKVVLVPDRKTINSLQHERTEDWVVGWADNRTVYILDYRNFEKESSHKYSEKEYFALIKHELVHCFTGLVSKYTKLPNWLSEGISIYLSGQNNFKKKPDDLKSFLEFYDKGGKGVYYESGFAVEFLVKKYGRSKLLDLIKSIKEVKDKNEFGDLFKKIYGFELKYKNFKVL